MEQPLHPDNYFCTLTVSLQVKMKSKSNSEAVFLKTYVYALLLL